MDLVSLLLMALAPLWQSFLDWLNSWLHWL